MMTRPYRSFVLVVVLSGLSACEREAPGDDVVCGNSCEENASECDPSGLLIRCEVGEDGCRSMGEPRPCTSRQLCGDGECRCTNPCEPGTSICDDGGDEVRCAQSEEDGCSYWSEPTPCPGGQTCEGGACDCASRCQIGETTCDGDGKLLVCAGPDGEGCNYWDAPEDCGDHRVCSEGACTCANPCSEEGATACSPAFDGVLTCQRETDGDRCFHWVRVPCDEGDVCVAEITECRLDTPPECDDVNECAYEGQKLCMSETQYRACHYTSEGCLVWDCGS